MAARATPQSQSKVAAIAGAFMTAKLTVKLPYLAALILAAILGAVQVLNQSTLALSSAGHAYLGLGLAIGAWLGVKPLVGSAFRDAFPLPNWALQLITAAIAVATIVVGILPAGSLAVVILSGLLTVLLGLGFGPDAPARA